MAKTTKTQDEASLMMAEKLKALQTTLDRIDKAYGKGSIMRMGEEIVEKVTKHLLLLHFIPLFPILSLP